MDSPMTARARSGAANATFAIISILSTAALLPFLNKSMFRDEGATLYSAHLSWAALWQQSLVVDRVLLAYYAVLHFWLQLWYSIEWARAPSLLAYGLTVYLVGVVAKRLAGFWCGLIAVAITCTNPLMISEALDARPYALGTLISVLSVAALMKWFDHRELRWIWLFSLFATVTLMLQLFLVLAPLSVLAAYAVMKPQNFFPQWRKWLVPIGLLFAAIVALLALVAHQQSQVAWIGGLNLKSFLEDVQGPGSAALGSLKYPSAVKVVGVLAVAGCIVRWRQRKLHLSRPEVEGLVVCLSWAVVPTATLIFITLVKPVYVTRYVTASVPGMAIALALLITFALRSPEHRSSMRKRIVLSGAMVAAIVLLIANSFTVARTPIENLKGAAQYIARNASRGSAVALPDHSLTTAMRSYLNLAGSPLRLWPQVSYQPFIEGLDLRQGVSAFMNAPSNVWLFNDGSVRGTSGFIARLSSHGFIRVSSTPFGAARVIHFRRS